VLACNMLARAFVAVGVIVLVARLTGMLFRRFNQPLVIGEIVGGIILGPTVLGAIWAGGPTTLFPAQIRPSLSVIGQVGLMLYMFLVGLRLNLRTVRSNKRMVGRISLGAILCPLALSVPLAVYLYPHHKLVGGHTVSRLAFFLFVGVSLSITAFPVLTRILEDRRMHNTELGVIATACAAVQDVLGWFMLAVVLVIVSAHGGATHLVRIVVEAAFCAVGIVIVSRLVARLDETAPERSGSGAESLHSDARGRASLFFPAVFALVLLCGGATQAIGLHSVFGAFVFGIALRRAVPNATAEQLTNRLAPVTLGVLLPIYFIGPGLSTNLRAIGSSGIPEILLIVVAACAGKLLGGYGASRASGLSTRQSAIMGTLMNTRGLIELVVLQVALAAGVLDNRLFSELVFMAVLTTMMTSPLLSLLMRRGVGAAPDLARSDLLALPPRLALDGGRRILVRKLPEDLAQLARGGVDVEL